MDGCALNLSVSALACALAEGKSNEEIAHLAVIFTQLGDSLATIASTNEFCSDKNNTVDIV